MPKATNERMNPYIACGFAAFLLAAVTAAPGVTWAASFTGLGDLSGGSSFSRANGVSTDGSFVVGQSDSEFGFEAFRWTSAGGMVGLGDLPGGSFGSRALGVSADGSAVGSGALEFSAEPVLWSPGGGPISLGNLFGVNSGNAEATGISADATVVVGFDTAIFLNTQAWLWTSAGGMVALGFLPGSGIFASANAISADGLVIVGHGNSNNGTNEAFLWTSEDGMVGLGDLPGGEFLSLARGVSVDGSVIVGQATSSPTLREAFRWTLDDDVPEGETPTGEMVGLGVLPGGNLSEALDVSGDGSVVVGSSRVAATLENEAFIWDSENGMQSLLDVLELDFGLDLTGWTLLEATAVSDDGLGNSDSLSIVGIGTNPSGFDEAFLARIPSPAPEPATSLLQAVALALLAGIRRRRAATRL